MLKKCIAAIISLSLFLESTHIFAQTKKTLTQENYKEIIYKTFSASKKIKNPLKKRAYLEKVLKKINTELEKIDSKKLQKKRIHISSKSEKTFFVF